MKIRCVSNIDYTGHVSDYLTTGKVYDMTSCYEGNNAGDVVSDHGDTIFVYFPDSSHGKWEVVE